MFKTIKSHWIIFVILLEKLLDILHQSIMGIPSLKRCQISAHIYLGGQYNLNGLKKLKLMGITAIVSMREDSIYNEAHFEGFKFLHLPTIDNTPPKMDDLIKGTEFIEAEINNNGKVYIHCRQGLGRGPSMVIAYLLKMGTTFDDAFALVKSVRPFIHPTPKQIQRLKELEIYFKESLPT
jgi:dual specificity MAP kinase phosphatase